MTETECDRLSNNISELEKPVAEFGFERWKFTLAGSFWGMLTGIAAAYLIPQTWVKNNKTLNKYFTTGAQYSEKIYAPRTTGMFAVIGTVIGGIVDFFRDIKRPTEAEYTHKIQELRQQETTPPDGDLPPVETNARMQERVAERRQEASHHWTR